MATGTFAMVTVESLPVGLLTSIGGAMEVSEGRVGLLVTVPGLVASASAPLLPVVIGRLDRRFVLLGLVTLMVGATALSAVATDFTTLLASRFLVGVGIGGFWALAAGIAVRLVPTAHVPRATAIAFGGATIANVLGIPAGTLIGGLSDWRVAFASVAGLGLVVALALLALLPAMPSEDPVRLRALAAQLRVPAVRAGVLATGGLVGGHWVAYAFISPILQDLSGVRETWIGPIQLGFGAAAIVGNFVLGGLAGRDPRRAIIVMSLVLATIMAAFPFAGGTPASAVILLVCWGFTFGGVPVGVQTWILKSAPDATEPATALNTSMFNLAIALGALTGGVVVDSVSLNGVLWTGAGMALLTLPAVARARIRR